MSQATQPIPTTREKSQGQSSILGRIFRTREIGVLAALLVLCMVMSFASPYFF